jgi:hypothetical protein
LAIFSQDIYGIKNLLDLEGIIYWSRKKKVKKIWFSLKIMFSAYLENTLKGEKKA